MKAQTFFLGFLVFVLAGYQAEGGEDVKVSFTLHLNPAIVYHGINLGNSTLEINEAFDEDGNKIEGDMILHQENLTNHTKKLIHIIENNELYTIESVKEIDRNKFQIKCGYGEVRFFFAKKPRTIYCGFYISEGCLRIESKEVDGATSERNVREWEKEITEQCQSSKVANFTDTDMRDLRKVLATDDDKLIVEYSYLTVRFSTQYPSTIFFSGARLDKGIAKITKVEDANETCLPGRLVEFKEILEQNVNNIFYLKDGSIKTLGAVSGTGRESFSINYNDNPVQFSFVRFLSEPYVCTGHKLSEGRGQMLLTHKVGNHLPLTSAEVEELKTRITKEKVVLVNNERYLMTVKLAEKPAGLFVSFLQTDARFSLELHSKIFYCGTHHVPGEIFITSKEGDKSKLGSLKKYRDELIVAKETSIYFDGQIEATLKEVGEIQGGRFKIQYKHK